MVPHGLVRTLRRFTVTGLAAALAAGTMAALGPAAPASAAPLDWFSGARSTSTSTILSSINASLLPTQGIDGRGVGVALVDTGVAPVPGLPAAQVINGPDLSVESQAPSLRYLDTYGHGTHMAGIIVGNDPAAGFVGLAPKAKLTSVKVGASDGAVDVTQVIAAIDWVVAHRNDDASAPIRVIALAYGTNSKQSYKLDPLAYAVENAWRAGIVVVVSAGNTGGASNGLTNPGADPFVLSVGSVSNDGTSFSWDDDVSTFTATSTGRKVDVLAPGESIVSLRDPGSNVDQRFPGARVGDRLFRGSGTSQATAVTAAAVALLLQKRPTLTPDQVKYLIKETASPLYFEAAVNWGIGELNLGEALDKLILFPHAQTEPRSTGTGTFEAARGGGYIVDDGVRLTGERDLFGPLTTTAWAPRSAARTAWVGGVWMGRRMAGDGWTGTSWASKTWAPAAWSGTSWSGKAWTAPDWNGRYWSGRYWSAGTWAGRYWSSSMWKSNDWAM